MIPLKSLLAYLSRPGVTEVVLTSGHSPMARVNNAQEAISPVTLSTDVILQLLVGAGGSRHVDLLGPRPTQWATRAEGVGPIAVSAIMLGDDVQATFTLRKRESAGPSQHPADPASTDRSSSVPASSSRQTTLEKGPAAPPSSRRPVAIDRGERGSSPAPPPDDRGAAYRQTVRERRPPIALQPIAGDTEAPLTMPSTLSAREGGAGRDSGAPRDTTAPRDSSSPRESGVGRDSGAPRESGIVRDSGAPRDSDFGRDSVPSRESPTSREAATPRDPALGRDSSAPRESAPPRDSTPARDGATPRDRPLAPRRPVPRDDDLTFELDTDPPRAAALPPPPAAFTPATRTAPAPAPRAVVPPPARPITIPPPASSAPETIPAHTPRSADTHSRLFADLLRSARDARTSDLHLVAARPPLVRLMGELVPRGEPLDPRVVEEMVLARVPARLLPALEQDGSCDFALDEPGLGRFRVNVSRHRTGLKASLRLIPQEVPTLASLGLPEAIAAATQNHSGLIVITGPTGQGKSTTLAALVDILNRDTLHHIITVEDPIEIIHPRKRALMSQREVGTHTRSFQSALEAALREDPDVLVVGELRDAETLRTALSASETGHLVIGTMSTPSAARTIDRIIDVFPPNDQPQVRVMLAGGLRLVVSQRLVPNEGRTAMVAAAELLPGLPALWNLIRDGKTFQIPSLQQRGKALGIVRLDDALADLVRAGKIATADALAVAEAPFELEATLSGRRAHLAQPPPPPKVEASLEQAGRALMDKARATFGRKGGS